MSPVNSVFALLGSVILAGYLLRRWGVVKQDDYKVYFKLVITLVIPCVIFSNFKNVTLTPEYFS